MGPIDMAEGRSHAPAGMGQVHATCIEVDGFGVLLRGPAGSGKSDLALRLIDTGARLVADDATIVAERGGRLVASAPATIVGRLEIFGVGIVEVPSVAEVEVGLVVDLVPRGTLERCPPPRLARFGALAIPLVTLDPFETSAAAKVRWAARALLPSTSPSATS